MRALIVSADRFEDSELSEPLQELGAGGVEVDIAAPQQGPITGKHGHRVIAGLALSAVRAEDYELMVLPGGEASASLRKIPEAVAIARHFLQADKPVAAICHGPQLLIATGLMAGRTATCYRAVRQELEAAGVSYLDREVVVDGNLVTSRQPADISAFLRAVFGIMGLSR
jgi:protease I